MTTTELDPKPYLHWAGLRSQTSQPEQGFIFKPRPCYNQDERDYR